MPMQEYELDKLLGRGAFGEVYKATHRPTGIRYAVKIVDLEATLDARRLLTEIQTLSRLRSNFLNKYYQSFQVNMTMWIVLEYCAGGLCLGLIQTFGSIPENVTSYIIKCVLRGVDYLHQENLIHRDIKLANIFITESGHIKLGDFGVSGEISLAQAVRRTVVGTPHWMAPEVIANSEIGYDFKADIWSIGITTIELLMGQAPTSGLSMKEALRLIPRDHSPTLQGNFNDSTKLFVARCLEKDARIRPDAKGLLASHYIIAGNSDARSVQHLLCRKYAMGSTNRKPRNIHLNPRKVGGSEAISWILPSDTMGADCNKQSRPVTLEGYIFSEACMRLYKRAKGDAARRFVESLRQCIVEGENEHKGLAAGLLEELFNVHQEAVEKHPLKVSN